MRREFEESNRLGDSFFGLLNFVGNGETAPSSSAVDLADIQFRAGKYDTALPLYQQQLVAISDPERGGQILFQVGQCLTGMRKYAEAVAAFENVVMKFPDSSLADDALLRKGAVQVGLLHQPAAGIAT